MGIRNHRQQNTYFQTVSITRKKYYDRFSSYSSSKLPNHNLFLICYSEVRGFCWPRLSSKESNNLVGSSVGLSYVCRFSVQKVPGSITVEPSLPKSIIKHLRWDPFTGEIVGVSLHFGAIHLWSHPLQTAVEGKKHDKYQPIGRP